MRKVASVASLGKVKYRAAGETRSSEKAARELKRQTRILEERAAQAASAPPVPVGRTGGTPQPPPPPQTRPATTDLVADELRKLASLRDDGILTNEEFAVQKKRLLDG